MSLYGDYIKEHTGDNILETDKGFATYRFLQQDNTVYIIDIYVDPAFRQQGYYKQLQSKISEIAKNQGYKKLMTTVLISGNNSSTATYILLKCGWKLKSCITNGLIFEQDVY